MKNDERYPAKLVLVTPEMASEMLTGRNPRPIRNPPDRIHRWNRDPGPLARQDYWLAGLTKTPVEAECGRVTTLHVHYNLTSAARRRRALEKNP